MNLLQLGILVLAAMGVIMMFCDQLLVAWGKFKAFFQTPTRPVPTTVEFDTADTFSKIRHLITLAEQSEAAGVVKAGELLRQAAANELLTKKAD